MGLRYCGRTHGDKGRNVTGRVHGTLNREERVIWEQYDEGQLKRRRGMRWHNRKS